ncbi:gamma-glutamyltransferase [Paraferrimonas sp. SM1919]|uniref:gamma-glutamyltransferase n=1 Tax=Paraferrimonas sp. SM1919 TaxID=2662263 RepID=UPI001F091368|nr:gamma-glutamyltransferase [Paraferrimonas sp. SM1919]
MPDSYSAQTAKTILRQGGNAIDAAIAAQFVLAVTLPEAGNIGGGGFMTIIKDGKPDFLDYREVAPLAAHRDMYLDSNGEVIPFLSSYGILSAGVPGTVDGMWQAHQKYGTMAWAELLAPAITLALEGFVVHPALAKNISWRISSFNKDNIKVNFSDHFAGAKAGTLFKQQDLAKTLMLIAKHGKAGFYQGENAKLLSNFMKANGGLISEADLMAYQALWRQPLVHNWRGYDVITAPPPSSGGIAMLQWLTMYDLVKADKTISHNSAQYVHLLAEIGKRVFADRAQYLGDPDFFEVPQQSLLAAAYLAQRAAQVSIDDISITKDIAPGLDESRDTTHFSIIDQWGNAVSNTTTINDTFGSGVVVTGAGYLLNDEMDDFSAKPGVPNIFGAVGGVANEIQPKKRMLSSMTPTIVVKQGQVKMITGSPGGTTIISSVYQSILNVIEFGMTAQQAVDAARFHHQLLPKDEIWHYQDLDPQVIKSLQQKGYQTIVDEFGDLQIIVAIEGQWQAASQSGEGRRGVALTFASQ